jgi:hypothetical protein
MDSPVRHAAHALETPRTDDAMDQIVDQMLAIVAAQQHEGGAAITHDDIVRIYKDVEGDPSRVYDDVMTLLTIRAMRLKEEEEASMVPPVSDAKLQWRELCHGLGLSECHEFFRILEEMPDDERDAALSHNGGFFQSLLWKLEEEERAADELEKTMALVRLWEEQDGDRRVEEQHPLEKLQQLFPDYKLHVIEDVYEAHGFDLDAAAAALTNIGAVDQVKSFASVLKANGPTTMWKSPVHGHRHASVSATPSQRVAVESLGQFPVLPAKSRGQGKLRNGKARPPPLDTQTPSHAERRRHRVEAPNAWNTQHGGHGGALETKLTTDLKLERLQRLLPSIDCELIRTVLYTLLQSDQFSPRHTDGSSFSADLLLEQWKLDRHRSRAARDLQPAHAAAAVRGASGTGGRRAVARHNRGCQCRR